MKVGGLARKIELVTDVVMPDHFAVCRIKKWRAVAAEIGGFSHQSFGITLGLHENILGAKTEFFCFNNPEDFAANAEGIIRGTILRRVLSYRARTVLTTSLGDVVALRSILLI